MPNYFPIAPIPGQWYSDLTRQTQQKSSSSNRNLFFAPMVLNARASFDRLAVRCNAFSSATNLKIAIYDSGGATPKTLLHEFSLSITSTGTYSSIVDFTLPPGVYWIGTWKISGTCALVEQTPENDYYASVIPYRWSASTSNYPNGNSNNFPVFLYKFNIAGGEWPAEMLPGDIDWIQETGSSANTGAKVWFRCSELG